MQETPASAVDRSPTPALKSATDRSPSIDPISVVTESDRAAGLESRQDPPLPGAGEAEPPNADFEIVQPRRALIQPVSNSVWVALHLVKDCCAARSSLSLRRRSSRRRPLEHVATLRPAAAARGVFSSASARAPARWQSQVPKQALMEIVQTQALSPGKRQSSGYLVVDGRRRSARRSGRSPRHSAANTSISSLATLINRNVSGELVAEAVAADLCRCGPANFRSEPRSRSLSSAPCVSSSRGS